MEIEGGKLYIIREDGESERFVFQHENDGVYMAPLEFFDDDFYSCNIVFTRSILSWPSEKMHILNKVYESTSRLMEMFFSLIKHDQHDYPYPRHAIESLRLFNLTDEEKEIVNELLKEFTHIYLVRDEMTGYTKIGRSNDPERRLQQLKKQDTLLPTPNSFYILRAWEDYPYKESLLHEQYYHKRIRGEWFDLSDEDIEIISTKWMS